MRITVVDNDRALLRSLEILLGAEGHEVACFAEPSQALEALETLEAEAWPELLLVDYMMPVMTGTDLLRALRRHRPSGCACVVITAHADQLSQSDLRDLGVQAVLAKPLDLSRLLSRVSAARDGAAARSSCHGWTGRANTEEQNGRSS